MNILLYIIYIFEYLQRQAVSEVILKIVMQFRPYMSNFNLVYFYIFNLALLESIFDLYIFTFFSFGPLNANFGPFLFPILVLYVFTFFNFFHFGINIGPKRPN